jgi:antirestriction protein
MNNQIESSVTFYELSAYNNGILKPFTIDLDNINNEEELLSAIYDELQLIGENCEEYIICNTNNIPSKFIGEWAIDSEYFDYKDTVNASYLEEEVFIAGLECGINLEHIEDAYSGQYNSDADFAESMAEECGMVDNNAAWPYTCIDWSWAARELMFDYCESNGHYFSNNY